MNVLKTELRDVLVTELKEYKVSLGNDQEKFESVRWLDITLNDNLLQELENVCHSYFGEKMKHQAEIKEKLFTAEQKISQLDFDLKLANNKNHTLHEEVERLRQRNKRLSTINNDLRNAENVVLREIKNCPHHEIKKDKYGIRAVSLIRMKQTEDKTYKLICTKCNHHF